MSDNFSLYIHIPFCLEKCPYCDFNTYVLSRIPEQEYIEALIRELRYRASLPEWQGREISTIFFGGGTPSIFKASSYLTFFKVLHSNFKVAENAEITLEANPGSVTKDSLADLYKLGFNRISFGAQSFTPERLRILGRVHSVGEIISAFEWAREVGFNNLSLDLMFGTPGQTQEEWESDVRQALTLSPDHISAYSLTYEKGTQYYDQLKKGKLKPVADDSVASMLEYLWDFLPEVGLKHYEVSNFSKPNYEARHNLAYWNGGDYIGLGAGAHSMLNLSVTTRRRWSNLALPNSYIESAKLNGQAESWFEVLDKEKVAFEFFMLGLRKVIGVELSKFERYFGREARAKLDPKILDLESRDLVEVEGDKMRLSRSGLKLADSVVLELVE